jgi:hypothetical protein
MTPTAWDLRNKLLAILNEAKHSGKPYLDLESGSLYSQMRFKHETEDVDLPRYNDKNNASRRPSSQRIPERRRRDTFDSL